MTQKITLTGLTCEACQKLLSKRIGRIDGVESVNVQLNGKTEIVAKRNITESEINNVLEGTKYTLVN